MLNKNEFLGALARAGLSQRALSMQIGMSKNTLSSRVNGRSFFDTEEIDKICDVLKITDGVRKSEIFLGKTSQNRDDEAEQDKKAG